MKNQIWTSLIVGVLISAGLVFGAGFAFAQFMAKSVSTEDARLTPTDWQDGFVASLGYGAALVALLTVTWLLIAHKGDGLDTKTGIWSAIAAAACLAGALLAVFVPPHIQQGPGLQVVVEAILVLLGYWLATLFMTPHQYHHTPFLGKLLWGHR
jgi:hypothetical protein